MLPTQSAARGPRPFSVGLFSSADLCVSSEPPGPIPGPLCVNGAGSGDTPLTRAAPPSGGVRYARNPTGKNTTVLSQGVARVTPRRTHLYRPRPLGSRARTLRDVSTVAKTTLLTAGSVISGATASTPLGSRRAMRRYVRARAPACHTLTFPLQAEAERK